MDSLKLEDIKDLLKGKFDGTVTSQSVKCLTSAGENYLSLVLKVDVKYLTNGFKPKEDTLHLVAKVASSDFLSSGPFSASAVFEKEIKWYSDVVPLLKGFTKIYDLEEFVEFYPKFYNGKVPKNADENGGEFAVLLLEHVGEEYKCYDRTIGFDYETSKLVIKTLARFHATTIALKQKKPELFKEKLSPVIEATLFKEAPPLPGQGQNVHFISVDVVRNVLAESHDHAHYIPRAEKALKPPSGGPPKPDVREPWAAVTHDDFWTNNILIKTEKNKPTKIKIVDFQMANYGSIAEDLVFFLLSSVKTTVLQTQLLDELIRFYYDQLILALKQFKLKTEIFSYDEYLSELKTATAKHQYGRLMFMLNFVYGKKSEETGEAHETQFDKFFENVADIPEAHRERILVVTDVCAKRNWI